MRLVGPSDVIDWAQCLVADGDTQEKVVALSVLPDDATEEVESLLGALADDVGLCEMTEARAGTLVAAQVARLLTSGELEPIDTAREIWRISRLAPSVESELRAFVGLASEWEDDPENRDVYEEDIRSRALRLSSWSGSRCVKQ
ncbi:hypothetical protein GCM10009675_06250 [Prauserella alba]|uniref:DUF4259 domain-containing protein n=1 Tax=Prauserella alba TaxID=176898 RepID=A0ABN1V6Q0_9PSEU